MVQSDMRPLLDERTDRGNASHTRFVARKETACELPRSLILSTGVLFKRQSNWRKAHGIRRFCASWAMVCVSLSFGCATPHATLQFVAPSAAQAGTAFTVTVNVVYQGRPDTVINSRIHFTSSDPSAALPPDYYFTPTDAGSHTWQNGFTLWAPGRQTISGAIVQATGINGSATIAVSN